MIEERGMSTMHRRFEAHRKVDSLSYEWAQWKREHDEWLRDISGWDRELRHLMLLTYELDKTLPYERRRLAQHMEEIQAHQRLLDDHGGVLGHYKTRISKQGWFGKSETELSSKLKTIHSRQRHQHARVKDSHLSLRQQHQQAMTQVKDIVEQFRKKVG
jgi:hypothetical protein